MSTTSFPHRPGISDEFLAKAGVTVLADPDRLHIAYHDIKAQPTGHFRDRFKAAVADADGKPQRYSQPIGSSMHAYLPPFPFEKSEDLYVTEGEFKALALTEAGYNAVALPGLTATQIRRFYRIGRRQHLPTLSTGGLDSQRCSIREFKAVAPR